MTDHNAIVEALRTVLDPVTGLDIIQAKRLSDFKFDGNNVSFTLNAAQFAQDIKGQIHEACTQAIHKVNDKIGVHIHLKSDGASVSHLPQVKNIIAVASGKGGVGKSTVALSLALSLQKKGHKVGLMDADLYGPSVPTMLNLQGTRPKVTQVYGKHKIIPIESHGLQVMSIGFIVEPEQAVVLRGPRLGGIIKQFVQDCIWPDLDYMIVDLPPGTGDIQLTLVQTLPITGAIMVTTPQKLSVIDAVKAMNMFRLENINVPILGVIENMSWFTPAELPDNKYYLFGEGGGKELVNESKSNLIGQVPLIQSVREAGDLGSPAILDDNNPLSKIFEAIADKTVDIVKMRNELHAPTRVVQVKR